MAITLVENFNNQVYMALELVYTVFLYMIVYFNRIVKHERLNKLNLNVKIMLYLIAIILYYVALQLLMWKLLVM